MQIVHTATSLIIVAAVMNSLQVSCHCPYGYPNPPANNKTRALPSKIVSNMFDLLNGLAAQKFDVIVSAFIAFEYADLTTLTHSFVAPSSAISKGSE